MRIVANTHGNISANYGGQIQTSHTILFRAGGQPVEMNGIVNLDDGDYVAVAGPATSTGIRGLAVYDSSSSRTFLAPMDNRKLFMGIFFMFVAITYKAFVFINHIELSGAVFPMMIGGCLVWLHSRENRRRCEAFKLLAARMRTPSSTQPSQNPIRNDGVAAFSAETFEPSVMILVGWFFRMSALLLILALSAETLFGLWYDGLNALGPLFSDVVLRGIPSAIIMWKVSHWLFETASTARLSLVRFQKPSTDSTQNDAEF
jgi:hypothetical protein